MNADYAELAKVFGPMWMELMKAEKPGYLLAPTREGRQTSNDDDWFYDMQQRYEHYVSLWVHLIVTLLTVSESADEFIYDHAPLRAGIVAHRRLMLDTKWVAKRLPAWDGIAGRYIKLVKKACQGAPAPRKIGKPVPVP